MNKILNHKKIVSVALMSAIFTGCFIPFVYAANKSQYTSTLSFDTTCTGASRYYEGQNIKISLYTYPTNVSNTKFLKSSYSKSYYVTLYRKGWFWHTDKISTGTANICQQSTIKWPNVGSGDYYFYFSKETNGINIASDEVIMANY